MGVLPSRERSPNVTIPDSGPDEKLPAPGAPDGPAGEANEASVPAEGPAEQAGSRTCFDRFVVGRRLRESDPPDDAVEPEGQSSCD